MTRSSRNPASISTRASRAAPSTPAAARREIWSGVTEAGARVISSGQWMDEQYFLDLEREAFLSLTGERKTLERIQSILTTGKPLRN